MNAIVGSAALPVIGCPALHPAISPLQNQLLASLSEKAQANLFPHLESCTLSHGTVLAEPGLASAWCYFPVDALISRHRPAEDGIGAAMSVAGNDGMIGIDLFMEDDTSSTVSVVQVGGHAFRVDARRLKREMDRHEELSALLARHAHALLAQTAQTAVCNRHHTLEQQLCRWLLLTLDRLPGHEFRMSQEQIAQVLGVERSTALEATRALQKAGIAKCFKGRVTLLDRGRLEAASCGCHEVITREVHRQWHSGMPHRDSSLGARPGHYH